MPGIQNNESGQLTAVEANDIKAALLRNAESRESLSLTSLADDVIAAFQAVDAATRPAASSAAD